MYVTCPGSLDACSVCRRQGCLRQFALIFLRSGEHCIGELGPSGLVSDHECTTVFFPFTELIDRGLYGKKCVGDDAGEVMGVVGGELGIAPTESIGRRGCFPPPFVLGATPRKNSLVCRRMRSFRTSCVRNTKNSLHCLDSELACFRHLKPRT